MNKPIPIAGPSITKLEIDCVTDAVTNAWYENANMYHEKLEQSFANYLGVRHATALPSCTSGIHLSLLALGIGLGDEVIIPEITWIATAAPVSYVGATPVFVDIDPGTWCISPESVEAAITPQTRAIITVDLYGNMADYDAIHRIASRHGIDVIEDAAEAVGATYKGRQAGSLGRTGVFSFHGSKTLTSGEGGLLATNDTTLFERVLFLRDHGRPPGDTQFQNTEVGYKYKMSSMQAALAYAQLTRIDELMALKHRMFGWYHDRLSDLPGIQLNSPGADVHASYWMISAVWDGRYDFDKKQLAAELKMNGIDTRPFFSALSKIPAYAGTIQARKNPNAFKITDTGINFPSSLTITEPEVEFICQAFRKIILCGVHQ